MDFLDLNCIFCKITTRAIDSSILFEDGYCLVFLDAHPVVPGHALVIPKFHAPTFGDLPESEVAPLFSTVHRASAAIKQALGCDGLTVGINDGRAAGQAVPHVHIHILPRFVGDGGGSIHTILSSATRPALTDPQIAAEIRMLLSNGIV